DAATGARVFAGQRAETFYIDLGAVFDTANLRSPGPLLTPAEDADDTKDPFGVNRFSGFNIHTIAIEVPITRITRDRNPVDTTDTPVVGMYASTSRREPTNLRRNGGPPRPRCRGSGDTRPGRLAQRSPPERRRDRHRHPRGRRDELHHEPRRGRRQPPRRRPELEPGQRHLHGLPVPPDSLRRRQPPTH